MREIFEAIRNFPNYRVSNRGRVINVAADRELKPFSIGRYGRLAVRLHNGSEATTFSLHKLVAEAFHPDYTPGVTVNFANGVITDCNVSNLVVVMDRGVRTRKDGR